MIKLSKNFYIILFSVLVLMLMVCFYISKNNKKISYEITDYLKNVAEGNMTEQQFNELWLDEEQVKIYFAEGRITDIQLYNTDDGRGLPWTLCGLRPGMDIEDVQQLLSIDGIVMERHNMQWYATGLALEKRGIKRLSWDPNDQITYVAAEIDIEKINELKDYELLVTDEKYAFSDADRVVDVVISYPFIELKNHKNITNKVNEQIESVVNEILQDFDVSDKDNVTLNVNYIICNVESESFSIEWTGDYWEKSQETEIKTAITFDVQKEGSLLEVTDFGATKEQIVEEIVWRYDVGKSKIYEQLEGNYSNFYVTPLHIVVFVEHPETKERLAISLWR